MIDIVFLGHNRRSFTKAAVEALRRNTDWSQVSRVLVYDDDSKDGTADYLKGVRWPVAAEFRGDTFGGPVAVMNHYLTHGCSPIWAKIDNDTMVPPGWLTECLAVMDKHPELDLLGIEAFYPVKSAPAERSYETAEHIGGIGLLRSKAFKTLPRPNGRGGRFGFTAWQLMSDWVTAGWINPALPVFLLDRMPMDPWVSLSLRYEKNGWQRPWDKYDESKANLWEWHK